MRSERNQGRAPDMGWLGHDRLGYNYRLTELQAALGIAQLERVDQLLSERARVASLYAEALAGLGAAPVGEGDPDGLVLAGADRRAAHRSWFVDVLQLPAGNQRDGRTTAPARAGTGSQTHP